MGYKNIINDHLLKYFILGMIMGFNFFSNLYAENPYHSNLFSQYSTFEAEHNYTAAKQEIEKILSNFPNNPEMQIYGHFYLGFADSGLKDWTSALPAFQYVIDHESELNNSEKILISSDIYLLGCSYLGLKQYGDATTQFMKVIDKYSDSKNCFLALGSGMGACYRELKIENETENMLLGIIQKYSKHKVKFYALHRLAHYYCYDKADYDKALATCQQILNELSLDKYPDLKDMKEKIIPKLIQDIYIQKSKKK